MMEFFPSKDCSHLLGGLDSSFDSLNVIGAEGKLQNVIAPILSKLQGSSFYVNAKKESGQTLYKYVKSDDDDSEELHHSSSEDEEEEEEKCLTFSLDDAGKLVAKGVDCETKLRPLCLDISQEHSDAHKAKCKECNPDIYQTKCAKWVDLELEESENGYIIEGAQICVEPCGLETYEDANAFCQVTENNL